MRSRSLILLDLLVMLVLLPTTALAQAEASATDPVASAGPVATAAPEPTPAPVDPAGPFVQGVFFFSPACGHCEYVISQHLPTIFADNGGDFAVSYDESLAPEQVAFYLLSNGSLQLLMVDMTVEQGRKMYLADADALGLDSPPGVPLLHIGDDWYVGSDDIPEELPGIVRRGLAGDGISWPPVPGLGVALAPFLEDGSVVAISDPDGRAILPAGDDEDLLDKIGKDPVGNGLSIIVLVLLVGSLFAAPVLAVRGAIPPFPVWLVPALSIVGIGVAAYLASVETSGSEAVCGPVGDCNTVQESEYASLLGVPIGVLGVIGYAVIIAFWAVSSRGDRELADRALVALAATTVVGTLFSAYLTFLEPFVIGATCLWCLSSAVIMFLLLWLTIGPGWVALQRRLGARA